MNELPFAIQKAVRKYENIEVDGFVLAPILVREYDDFLIGCPALETLHQSLPVAFMRVPLLTAYYQMDYAAALRGEQPVGLFTRALIILALSLRLGEGQEIMERVKMFNVVVDRNDPQKLLELRYRDENDEEHGIKPVQFKLLRQIIAAQNGVELESDMANPDIVAAKHKMNAASGVSLDANIEDLISAISALSGTDESAIYEWPIRKLNRYADSYRRILEYIVNGIGEASGASWKDGNPTPHPFFKRSHVGGLFSPLGASASGAQVKPPKEAEQLAQIAKNL